MRQLFFRESMAALRALNEHMPPLVRLAAETGRRPGELVSLKYDCIETESEGGPFLIYTETKVTAGQERKLPVLSAVVDTVREQQLRTRQRHADTPIEHLRLFPRSTMNPHGYHPMGSLLFGDALRKWINELPSLDSDAIADDRQPLPFDRTLISGYSFRHTYAQRHADAGIAPDVLMAPEPRRSVDAKQPRSSETSLSTASTWRSGRWRASTGSPTNAPRSQCHSGNVPIRKTSPPKATDARSDTNASAAHRSAVIPPTFPKCGAAFST